MKSLVGIAGAGALFVSAVGTASAADQRDWCGPMSGTSIAAPASWSEPSNWADSTPPSTMTDIANFGSMANNIFVALPSALTFGALHQTGDGTVHLLGDKLTVAGTGWSGNAGTVNISAGRLRSRVYVWADVTATKDLTGLWSVMGDMNVKGQVLMSLGTSYWRGYLYANSASEDRSDAVVVEEAIASNGHFDLLAPHGTPARDSVGWSQTDKSPLVSFVGTTIGRIAPGCRVSGPGIPEGTFLKRYYEGFNLIELSQPVTATIASNTLHFDAYQPVTTAHIKKWNTSRDNNQNCVAKMSADGGTFTVSVDELSNAATYKTTFDGGTYPAKFVIARTTGLIGAALFQNQTDMFYTQPTSGTAGLSKAKDIQFASHASTAYRARIGVAEGVDALYTNVSATASNHTISKYGAGSLRMDFADSLTTVASPLSVEEGTLAVSLRAASVKCADVSIAAGATFKVVSGTAAIAALTAESGATIEAEEGTTVDLSFLEALPAGLRLTGAGSFVILSLSSITGVDVDSGVTLTMKFEGDARGFKPMTPVTPAVVGEPAFWVDASKNVTTFSTNGVNRKGGAFSYTDLISCWRDCRYEDDPERYGVYYATNDLSSIPDAAKYGYAPSRVYTRGNFTTVRHRGDPNFALTESGSGNMRWVYAGMKWSQPITGIRAVFAVTYQDGSNGQAILGGTRKLFPSGYGDFTRAANSATDGAGIATPSGAYLFSLYAADIVKNGWIYADGVKKPWNVCVYQESSIEIRESHPLAPGGKADAFAIQDFSPTANPVNSSGLQEHYEVLIYTNELTMAERDQVYAYLAKKYYGLASAGSTGGGSSRYDGNGHISNLSLAKDGGLTLSVNEVLFADKVSGDGTFVKKGEGTFYADLVEGASLTVKEGAMVVHSAQPPTSYADLPTGHFLHWDAANTNNMVLKTQTDTINDNFDESGNASTGYSFQIAHTNLVDHWYDAQYGNDGQHVYGTGRKSDAAYRVGWLVTNQLNGLPAVDYGPIFNYKTGMSQSRRYFHEFHLTDRNEPIRSSPISAMFMVKNTAGGGNLALGYTDSTSGYGIARSSTTADYTVPITSKSGISAMLNGETIDPMKTGYSGGWDQLSLYCQKNCSGNLLGANLAFTVSGGMKLGEVLIYTNALGWADARAVDAYLGNKWFNRTMPYAAPSSVGTLSVAVGATLTVEGGVPLAVSSLRPAGGTINGALTLAAGAVIDVYITETGTIAAATVTGAVDLSAGGTIIVHGDPLLLAAGDYRLVSTTGLAFDAAKWMVTVENPTQKRSFSLRSDDQGLVLGVTKPGVLLIVR